MSRWAPLLVENKTARGVVVFVEQFMSVCFDVLGVLGFTGQLKKNQLWALKQIKIKLKIFLCLI